MCQLQICQKRQKTRLPNTNNAGGYNLLSRGLMYKSKQKCSFFMPDGKSRQKFCKWPYAGFYLNENWHFCLVIKWRFLENHIQPPHLYSGVLIYRMSSFERHLLGVCSWYHSWWLPCLVSGVFVSPYNFHWSGVTSQLMTHHLVCKCRGGTPCTTLYCL